MRTENLQFKVHWRVRFLQTVVVKSTSKNIVRWRVRFLQTVVVKTNRKQFISSAARTVLANFCSQQMNRKQHVQHLQLELEEAKQTIIELRARIALLENKSNDV